MIREGIDTAEKEQSRKIPDNYRAVIGQGNASKTSVRNPRDYPVLAERFAK